MEKIEGDKSPLIQTIEGFLQLIHLMANARHKKDESQYNEFIKVLFSNMLCNAIVTITKPLNNEQIEQNIEECIHAIRLWVDIHKKNNMTDKQKKETH